MGERRIGVFPAATEKLSSAHVAVAYIVVLVVFILDMMLPLGIAVPCLYLLPLSFLALWSTPKQSSPALLLAGVCMVLITVGFFLSPFGPLWVAVVNRLCAITIIGVTTVLSLLRKRTEEQIKVLHGLLPICSYCKKIRDDEGFWQQVERYISVRSEADFSHGMCPDCGTKHFSDMAAGPATKASVVNPLGFFGQPESIERPIPSAHGLSFSAPVDSRAPLGHQTKDSISIR